MFIVSSRLGICNLNPISLMEGALAIRGEPKYIRPDNGPELIFYVIQNRLKDRA